MLAILSGMTHNPLRAVAFGFFRAVSQVGIHGNSGCTWIFAEAGWVPPTGLLLCCIVGLWVGICFMKSIRLPKRLRNNVFSCGS